MLETRRDNQVLASECGGVVCSRCGRLMTPPDATETMLAALSQLAQFGLDAEGRPLLESRDEDH